MKAYVFITATTFMFALNACVRLAVKDFKGDGSGLVAGIVIFFVLNAIFGACCALTYEAWENRNATEETPPHPSDSEISRP